MPLLPILASHAVGGTLVRFGRDTTPVGPVVTAPGTVSSATTSNVTSSAATLSWGPPANNGGSPVTGYVVSRDGVGGTSVTLPATASSYQFLNLSASTTYHLSVSATNSAGTGTATTKTVTTAGSPGPVSGARFPGDPQPLVTRKLYFGGETATYGGITVLEGSGTKVGVHRLYYDSSQSLTPPNAGMFSQVRTAQAANRLPYISLHYPASQWAGIGNGSQDSVFDAMIAEYQSYAKPVLVTLIHEPENDGGVAANWRAAQSRFRARLNAWIAANPSKPNRIAFGQAALMDWTFSPESGRNPEDWWVAGIWDFLSLDVYAWGVNTNLDASNVEWANFMAYQKAKGLPYVVAEWGIRHDDPNKAAKIQAFYDLNRDGAHDCIALCYFNVSNGGTYDWPIEDTDALQLSPTMSTWNSITAASTSIHMSDLGY